MQTRRLLPLVASLALAVGAAPASATVTHTTITQPANGTVLTVDRDSADTIHIAGTSDGASGDVVNLYCYLGDGKTSLATSATVQPDHSFSVDATSENVFYAKRGGPCVLRAVPQGAPPTAPPGSPSPFDGPTITIQGTYETRAAAAPNAGVLKNFYLLNVQSQGSFDYVSAGYCGLYDSFLWDPVTLAPADSVFYCNAGLLRTDGSTSAPTPNYAAATGSELQVDGKNAYLPGALPTTWGGIDPDSTPGLPHLTWARSFDPSTGAVTITESDPAVVCSPDPSKIVPTASSCSQFVPAGVRLDRKIVQSHDGRLAIIRDSWSSTDGAAHALRLEFENDQHANTTHDVGYMFPWLSSSFQIYPVGTTLSGPSGAPGRIYVASSIAAADGDTAYARGVIVFSNKPDSAFFNYRSTSVHYDDSDFLLNYGPTVPASGSVQMAFAYGDAFKQADVTALGDAAEAAFTPTVTVSAPATSATQQVTVSGTASDGAGLASLSVNGQPVTVAPDGSWSATLALAPGSNAITAHAVNVYGVAADAHATTVTPTHGKLALSGRARVSGSFVVFRAKCIAGASLSCPGAAQLASKERYRGRKLIGVSAKSRKVRTKTVTVGSKRFLVKGGSTVTLKVALNARGKKLLKRFRKLPMRLTVTFTAPGAKARVGSAKLVMRAPKKKH